MASKSTPAEEPTDKQIEDDEPMLPLSTVDKVFFWGVLICCSIAFGIGFYQWIGFL